MIIYLLIVSTLYTKIIPFVKTAVDAEEVVICKNCPHKNEEMIRAIPVEKLGGSLKASTMLSPGVCPSVCLSRIVSAL